MLKRTICSAWIWAFLMLATFQAHAWMDGWRDCGDCCYYDDNNCGCGCGCWDNTMWRFYGGYSFGRDVGVDDSYATIGLTWFPSFGTGSWKPFIDVEGHWIHGDNDWAANAGIGVRYMDPCSCDSLWGANIYYDYRRGRCKSNYNQIGVGLEWLHPSWDVRVNGYFPVGDDTSRCKRNVFRYPGGAIITCQEQQSALTGFDAEIGAPLWCCNCWSLYAAIGPYYYTPHNNHHRDRFFDDSSDDSSDGSGDFSGRGRHFKNRHHHNIWGGRVRAALRWNDWIELAVSGTRDNHFKTRVLATITLAVPFEALCNPCQCEWNCYKWCDQPVHRQPIIGLENRTCFNANF